MAFSNHGEDKKGSPITQTEKEKKILENISFLGKKEEEARGQLNQYSDLSGKISLLESDIKRLEERKGTILSETKELSEKLSSLKGEIGDAETKKSLIHSDILSLTKKGEDIKGEIGRLEGSVKSINTVLVESIKKHDSWKSKQSSERDDLVSSVSALKGEFAEISNKVLQEKYKFEETLCSINAQKKEKSDIEFEMVDISNQINDKKIELARLQSSLVQIQEEHKVSISARENTIASRERELDERAGDLSKKESWLMEKENTLKNAKNELEKFYNRKISNVNF